MAQRAGPALRECGSEEARGCGALPMHLVAAAAAASGPTRVAILETAGLAALPDTCTAAARMSSLALWQACPPPPPLTTVAEGLVQDLAVGEVAFVLAVARALHEQGLLASPDGERLVSTLLLSMALARSG